MKKIVRLSIAATLLALAGFSSAAAVYCPELPADCCRTGWVGGCRVCVQTGC